jgi:hypothetical protein
MKKVILLGAVGLVAMQLVMGVIAVLGLHLRRVQIQEWNKQVTAPVEMMPAIREVAEEAGVPWAELVAYLAIVYQYQVPVPSRKDLVIYAPPTEGPVRLKDVEPIWEEKVREWLIGAVEQLRTRPLEHWIPLNRKAEFGELADSYEAWDEIRLEAPDEWYDSTEGEAYTQIGALLDWPYLFPVDHLEPQYINDWGFDRPQNLGLASLRHHGTDIFVPRGTWIIAPNEGIVEHAGWNALGGWTCTVMDESTGVRFYFAHMNEPAVVQQGDVVERGELLGYVGTSGEGEPGTDNKIAEPHLHFGMYMTDPGGFRYAVNPYPYLVLWQAN